MLSAAAMHEYQALVHGGGFVDLASRTQIELTGPDAISFLHNLCTNDIRKLQPGEGCEAFITSVQGKLLGHGYVFRGEESLIFDTVPGQAPALLAHFEKYHIREKIHVKQAASAGQAASLPTAGQAPGQPNAATTGGSLSELLIAGPACPAKLMELFQAELPAERCAHRAMNWCGQSLSVRRVDIVSDDCFLISCGATAKEELLAALSSAGIFACGCEAFAAARIERGTPLYGVDISDKNLPQEVNRNERAISFTKGCYLGQETVARIDALGHVNQTLCGVQFASDTVPPPGMELLVADKPIGRVTSAAFSPRLGHPLALAYVRRGQSALGTKLGSEVGEAEVVELPVKV